MEQSIPFESPFSTTDETFTTSLVQFILADDRLRANTKLIIENCQTSALLSTLLSAHICSIYSKSSKHSDELLNHAAAWALASVNFDTLAALLATHL